MSRKRLVAVALGIYFLFSLLIFQFFNIQIVEGKRWDEVAKRQHFFVVKEPFRRGAFWSNTTLKEGHPEEPQRLVFDILKYHLYADPLSIPDAFRGQVADAIALQLNFSTEAKLKLRGQLFRRSRSRKLAQWIDQEKQEALLRWWQGYARQNKIARNALYFVPDYQRSYPFGKLLGQVLHTVHQQRDEHTQQPQPTGGLELVFDEVLKGKQGKRLLQRSPRHSFETGQVIEFPEDGADIYLTVNHYLQAIAEEEVEKGVKQCGAKSGWAAMMHPKTGEILALAQYPFFYPGRYPDYFNDPDKVEWTKVKAVIDANEPGSTMKPITTAIALLANQELERRGEQKLFDPEEMVPCLDGRFPGRKQPIKDTIPCKYLDMNMAVQKSSNIYVARLVQKIIGRLGDRWYRQALQKTFGYGLKTGIELPSESPGLLPLPGKLHPNGALEWSVPTPFSLAMGYNLQANSIQILRALAVLANGGMLIEPTLIRKIVKEHPDGTQEVLFDNTRLNPFPQVLDPAIARRTVKAMKYVTKQGGTGRRGDILGFTEVGKSGTVHKLDSGVYSQERYVASFIGFAPVEDPAFVLIVVMDEPKRRFIPGVGYNHRGSHAAAPVFKEIAKRTLEYLGSTPDDPYGYPVGDPRYNPDLADWAKESRLLQEKYKKWNIPAHEKHPLGSN